MHAFLQAALDEVDRTAASLDAAALARNVEGRWSVAQILKHLTLAFTAHAAALDKALESGELRARQPVLKQRFFSHLVIDVGYFPRVEAPTSTQPRGSIPADQSLAAIRDALARLDATLTRIEERFGSTLRVSNHPYFAGLTVHQWRKFHWRHTAHHMKQVRARHGQR